jgi:hypothetical protein
MKKNVELKIGKTTINHIVDDCPEVSFMDSERLKEYDAGQFCFIGIKVSTEILTSLNEGKDWLINTITSGGLWGIESDSDSTYLKEVEQEEMIELEKTLNGLGFSDSE